MNETIRPKRNRRRYNEIRRYVKRVIECRRRDDEYQQDMARMAQHWMMVRSTFMVAVRELLNLPVPKAEAELADYTHFESYPFTVTRPWLATSMKYLSSEFTPDKLFQVWESKSYRGDESIREWFCIRWAIIQVVEGKAKSDIIPTAYYIYQNEEFFFDSNELINPKGTNRYGWERVRPKDFIPAREQVNESPLVKTGWWASLLDYLGVR